MTWDLDAAQRERLGEAPVFIMGGETFNCLPAIPAGLVLGQDGTEPRKVSVMEFIRLTLLDEDWERFQSVLSVKGDKTVDDSTVADLFSRLVEHYTGHPTEPPSASSDGERPTSPSSKVVSLDRGIVEPSDETATG